MLSGQVIDKFVSQIGGEFVVRGYQRGYRWTDVEVRKLLDDLKGHVSKSKNKGSYCLQPVVVKRLGSENDSPSWELIDGQQRLTTLYLLIGVLQTYLPRHKQTYSLRYETLKENADYLDNPDLELSKRNIDFFHIYQAHETIKHWFDEIEGPNQDGAMASNIARALTESVRVIWYEAPKRVEASELFARLNNGKIPLDDSELFKALLLSEMRDKANEIVAQWDTIERDLRDPDMWAFLCPRSSEFSARITLLLELLEDCKFTPGSYKLFDRLRTRVQAETAEKVWGKVVALFDTVLGWYRDHDLYHHIGYLSGAGYDLRMVVRQSGRLTKRQFLQELQNMIRYHLNVTQTQVPELSYDKLPDKAEKLLLLMNVETVRGRKNAGARYPFQSHKAENWSLEHIHAQHSQGLATEDQWRQWLELHQRALERVHFADDKEHERLAIRDEVAHLLKKRIERHQFEIIAERIRAVFTADRDDVHAISNLALLPSDLNSALGNAVFEVKREHILNMDKRGEYIPICTRQVFLKYFTEADAQQFCFWSSQDRDGYLAAMIEKVGPYLLPEKAE